MVSDSVASWDQSFYRVYYYVPSILLPTLEYANSIWTLASLPGYLKAKANDSLYSIII